VVEECDATTANLKSEFTNASSRITNATVVAPAIA
jgi:hypothetical protein